MGDFMWSKLALFSTSAEQTEMNLNCLLACPNDFLNLPLFAPVCLGVGTNRSKSSLSCLPPLFIVGQTNKLNDSRGSREQKEGFSNPRRSAKSKHSLSVLTSI
jgi:hypothetical protein